MPRKGNTPFALCALDEEEIFCSQKKGCWVDHVGPTPLNRVCVHPWWSVGTERGWAH